MANNKKKKKKKKNGNNEKRIAFYDSSNFHATIYLIGYRAVKQFK